MANRVDRRQSDVPANRRCVARRCPERRAVVSLPDGRTGRVKYCHSHLQPSLRKFVVSHYHTKNGSDSENDSGTAGKGNKCGAGLRHSDGKCKRPAGSGTSHPGFGACKLHGGSTPNANVHAAKSEAVANSVVMGMPIDIDPLDALLHCVRVSAGEVQYCTLRIHALNEADATVQFKETEKGEGEKGYKDMVKESTATDLNIWIRARQGALERLAKFSKMAIDAGVAERQVKVAETMGTQIGILIQGILTGLQLSKRQWQLAPTVVREHLAIIEGVATEIGE